MFGIYLPQKHKYLGLRKKSDQKLNILSVTANNYQKELQTGIYSDYRIFYMPESIP